MSARSTRRGQRRDHHEGMGGSYRESWWISSSLGGGGQGAQWDSPRSGSWCPVWKSGKLSLSWSERLGPQSALPTQKMASSTLSVKLQRPPFMDLEISLHVSAFACQAQIFQGQKTDRWPPIFFPLNLFQSVCETTFLGSQPSMDSICKGA